MRGDLAAGEFLCVGIIKLPRKRLVQKRVPMRGKPSPKCASLSLHIPLSGELVCVTNPRSCYRMRSFWDLGGHEGGSAEAANPLPLFPLYPAALVRFGTL